MKKIFLGFVLFLSLGAMAQTKKAPAKKPVASAPALKTLSDSASYAIGLSVVSFYKQQGMASINTAMVSKAINDMMANKTPLLDEQQANNAIMKYMGQAQQAKAKPTIEAGEKFLAANKNKAGVKTTASGLQYEVLTQGTGPKPTAQDSVTVNYVGKLLDGNEFDNSYKRGQPITFQLSNVIKGWSEGLQLMPEGSKYRFYIPYQLAYGTNEMGPIPAGSLLIFDVELLKVIHQ